MDVAASLRTISGPANDVADDDPTGAHHDGYPGEEAGGNRAGLCHCDPSLNVAVGENGELNMEGSYACRMGLPGSRHRAQSSHLRGPLALARSRPSDEFSHIVAATVSYLKGQWPHELETLRVDVVSMPLGAVLDRVPRWSVDKKQRSIRIYRLPIERLTRLHKKDRWHKRVVIESVVFSAVAEMLGTDPWQLAPERFHPH
jgi:hypothetical protein